ncbi:protein FAR1-RELATED SEQUENCE 5-like [Silene latifolia]|uniref:protein FAR1-RELATED SEQUENCE 5-like n=1 Tax=Silene latifolia TaxID=37657 RepID=UPI003D776A49
MEFTPRLGMFFSSLAEAVLFYKVYALSCGFEPRLYTTKKLRGGEIYNKFVDCNQQGFRESRNVENKSNIRSVKITRVGCLAMIRFRYNGKGYVVDMFHDFHNHILCSVKDAHLQKLTRKLNAFHKQTIINNSKVNIGASTSFRVCKEYANGYENVHASLTEFKNFNRDVKCFIGGKDAQMVIDRFKDISETSKGFDATYGTNKYNMMFAPFTGVDHHKKSVTFGATLLEHEDEESFKCIYSDRAQWIPAYFTDLPMSCILRTTQRSESENSFFKRFENKFGTLVEFLLSFQSAIDQQRYAQTCLDKDSDHALPNLVSPLGIEKHASTLYTHAFFKEFQGEVETAICSCGVVGVIHDIDHEYSEVGDGISGKIFRVVTIFVVAHDTVDENVDATHYHKLAVSVIWSEFYSIFPVLKSLPEGQVKELSCLLKSFREKFCPQDVQMTKDQEMEQLLGCSSTSTVTILPPRRAKNKGRGKRMLSDKKKAI